MLLDLDQLDLVHENRQHLGANQDEMFARLAPLNCNLCRRKQLPLTQDGKDEVLVTQSFPLFLVNLALRLKLVKDAFDLTFSHD